MGVKSKDLEACGSGRFGVAQTGPAHFGSGNCSHFGFPFKHHPQLGYC